ncbi:hypothetical protein NCG89_11465 [Spongiibacter taiwanensis]|uniref:glycosyltransferase n=1 Tax=Spongiibacter taiwanensis TaxID=1748242 RepID=UPI002034DDBD|nr:glycosyltransferase [Spongiibacter taiwanensis]USA42139.1 hypothetical protein NCG89_11465 [Spongiibacter taiwanensis]
MIFVTVGTQLPFPRLIENVLEEISLGVRPEECEVVCQSADVGYKVENFSTDLKVKLIPYLSPEEFSSNIAKAQLVISHAGMGNILTCLEEGKCGLFLARSSRLGEHRNDHQFDTVNSFLGKFSNVKLFTEESEFRSALQYELERIGKGNVEKCVGSGPLESGDMLKCKKILEDFLK